MSDESAVIRRLWQDYADAVNAGDVGRYGATLTDDVVFQPPDQKPLTGKGSVQKWFKDSWLDTTTKRRLSFQFDEVQASDTWAFARGPFTVQVTWTHGANQDISGTFLNVFKRVPDGSWKFARVSFNFDKPFTPAQ